MSAREEMNARETLEAVAKWLGWQDENLSAGLRSPQDALKLWEHWQANAATLPEMADEEVEEEGVASCEEHRILVLGYDPMDWTPE